jgi:putative protease
MRDYETDPALYQANIPHYKEEIAACTYREFTTGFFYGKPSEEDQIYDGLTYKSPYTYLGVAEREEDGRVRLIQKNKFSVGEEIEIMKPDGRDVPARVLSIRDNDGNEMPSAHHAKQEIHVSLSAEAESFDILRRKN